MARELAGTLIIGIVSMAYTAWLYTFLRKYIYLRIDLKMNSVQYGSLFFSQESDLKNLIIVKKLLYPANCYKIKIDGKTFKLIALDTEWIEKIKEKGL